MQTVILCGGPGNGIVIWLDDKETHAMYHGRDGSVTSGKNRLRLLDTEYIRPYPNALVMYERGR